MWKRCKPLFTSKRAIVLIWEAYVDGVLQEMSQANRDLEWSISIINESPCKLIKRKEHQLRGGTVQCSIYLYREASASFCRVGQRRNIVNFLRTLIQLHIILINVTFDYSYTIDMHQHLSGLLFKFISLHFDGLSCHLKENL